MWVSGAGKAAIDSFVRARCTCAQTQCSGHGVCYGHYELSASELQCYCDEGFACPTCATEAPPTNRQLKPSTASAVSTTVPSVSAAGLAGDRRENTAAGRAASNTLRNRGDGVVMCPDGLAWCQHGQTCAQGSLGPWLCCPFPNATICSSRHCCPSHTTCSGSATDGKHPDTLCVPHQR